VGPPLKATIKFQPPQGKLNKEIEESPEVNVDKFENDFPCMKGVSISHSNYNPRLIIRVDKSGKIVGYYNKCWERKEGYFEFILPDSTLDYFNRQIEKMNYKKLNPFYDEINDGTFLYDGPQYFLSFKDGGEEKHVLILNKYKGPKNIIAFVDSLFNYFEKMELLDTTTEKFRRDTIVVRKQEEYWENIGKNIIPLQITR